MTPTPRLVPDRPTPDLLARLSCLGTLLQQLSAQTACAAVNEAIEALQDAALAHPSRGVVDEYPTEGHACHYKDGDGKCQECSDLASNESVRKLIEAAVTEHCEGGDLWLVTHMAARKIMRELAALPAEMSPEFTDSARAALAWVLYHHQGGSSSVGQSIRFALGMGSHDELSAQQISDAKRWAAIYGQRTSDFHDALPAVPDWQPIDTAPTDRHIIGYGPRVGRSICFHDGKQWQKTELTASFQLGPKAITHWQPLAAAPAQDKSA